MIVVEKLLLKKKTFRLKNVHLLWNASVVGALEVGLGVADWTVFGQFVTERRMTNKVKMSIEE